MKQTSAEHIMMAQGYGERVSPWPYGFGSELKAGEAPCFSGVSGLAVLLAAIFFIPVTLVWTGIIPFSYRFHTSAAVLAAMAGFCAIRRYSLYDLGFRSAGFGKSMAWNGLFCLTGALGLYLIHKAGFHRPRDPFIGPQIYLAYIFILAPVQEIFFRGLLFAEFSRSKLSDKRWVVILLTSLAFSFLHVIYHHPPMIPVTFLAGLAWGLDYDRHRNIWGISLSHGFLGSLAMVLGII